MAKTVKLDRKGIASILKSQGMRAVVHEAAEDAAADLRTAGTVTRHNVEVEVHDYTTDRAASAVTIAHPAGLAMQAKHGVLTKAAQAAGLRMGRKQK
jgi:hypothetical protein